MKNMKKIGLLLAAMMSISTVGAVQANAIYVNSRAVMDTPVIGRLLSVYQYRVNTANGVNIRSGAGTNYSVLGGALNGTEFTVDTISEGWGHTDSIPCSDGTVQSGWINLDYCICEGVETKKAMLTAYQNAFQDLGITSYSAGYQNGKYYEALLNSCRTGPDRNTVLNIARSQIGYCEGSFAGTTPGSNNLCEYNRWFYNSNNVSGSAYAWCAVFVSWCMTQAQIPADVYPSAQTVRVQSVSQVKAWFNSKQRYKTYSAYTPKPGDLAIFSAHIGIVESVSGAGKNARVTLIEGNSSEKVSRYAYTNNGNKIIGYCVPNY